MKIKRFSRENTGQHHIGKPTVHISKTGLISFSRNSVESLNLKQNDRVELIQDEDNPQDWYVVTVENEGGFILRKGTYGQLLFNSSMVVDLIQKSLPLELRKDSLTFLIASQPEEIEGEKIYAILTSSIK